MTGINTKLSAETNHVSTFNGTERFDVNSTVPVSGYTEFDDIIGGGVGLYKLAPTVTSNNLNLAIKHLDGTDGSVANPIRVKIGNTVRKITAALSVTLPAGTNWMNLGSLELQTLPCDLFPYLIWNTNLSPAAVDIMHSRYAGGALYSDFSTTTTNQKYAAINATAPKTTDECQNIGRFEATLSAGAGYTWTSASANAPTNENIKNYPIFESRVMDWVSQLVGLTAATLTGTIYRYQVKRYTIIIHEFRQAVDGTSNGTTYTGSLPFTAKTITSGILGVTTTTYKDNSVASIYPGIGTVSSGSNILTFSINFDLGVTLWTATGTKRIRQLTPFEVEW